MIRLSWTIILEFSILILTDWKIANFNGFNFNPGQSFTLGSLSSSNEVWRVIIFIFSPPSSEHYHEKFVARAKLSLAMREGKLWVMLQLLTSHSPDCWCAGRQSWPDRETTPGWPIRWWLLLTGELKMVITWRASGENQHIVRYLLHTLNAH